MVRTTKLIATIIWLISSLPALAADAELLPSEMTVLVNHAMLANPGTDRRAVTGPLIARMQTDNLDNIESFKKGEAHFLHLQPEESRDEFWPFREREDNLGRVANQRLMIIRINAFQMVGVLSGMFRPRSFRAHRLQKALIQHFGGKGIRCLRIGKRRRSVSAYPKSLVTKPADLLSLLRMA